MTHPLAGKWRIVEMELWDREFIDLLGPGYITFDDQGGGEFCFGAATGEISFNNGDESSYTAVP